MSRKSANYARRLEDENARLRERAQRAVELVSLLCVGGPPESAQHHCKACEVADALSEDEPGPSRTPNELLCPGCGIVAVLDASHTRACIKQQLANAARRSEPCPWCRGPLASDERFNMGPPVFSHHHSCPRSGE